MNSVVNHSLDVDGRLSENVELKNQASLPLLHEEGNVSGAAPLVLEPQAPERLDLDSPNRPVQTPPKSPRNRLKPFILVGLGVGAIALSTLGIRWWQYSSTHQETDNAAVAADVYQISSRIPGSVVQVPVKENQEVQTGQLLVQIDPRDYQVKVQQAQAALAVAQRQANAAQQNIALAGTNAQAQNTEAQGNIQQAIATISAAQANVQQAQSGVPAAQAALAQANANLEKAQADFNRYQSLYQSGAISAQQRDAARASYDVAQAQQSAAQEGVTQAQAKLVQAQQGVSQAQAQLQASRSGLQRAAAGGVQTTVNRSNYAAAQASIAQAEANLAQAELQLSYTQITAPATGHVGRKTVEPGQQVNAGQPLMAVVGEEPWIIANFKETQVQQMRPNEVVEIKLDAFPGRTFVGRVESLSPASGSEFALLPPDNATGNFTKVVQRIPVKITFDPQSIQGIEAQITPGMSATVSVETR